MSESPPKYDDGRSTHAAKSAWVEITNLAVNHNQALDEPVSVDQWRGAVVSAVADLARYGRFRPGDRLVLSGRVERKGNLIQSTARVEVLAASQGEAAAQQATWGWPPYRCPICGWVNESWAAAGDEPEVGTARALLLSAAAVAAAADHNGSPRCDCPTCRMLAAAWDNPTDAEYDSL